MLPYNANLTNEQREKSEEKIAQLIHDKIQMAFYSGQIEALSADILKIVLHEYRRDLFITDMASGHSTHG